MSICNAVVDWSLGEGKFLAGRYSRAHQLSFDGGAVLAGSSSPAVVPVPWSDPAGVDPEEMFVASLSSCHMLWFLDYARRAKLAVAAYRDQAEGVMEKDADGRVAITRVTLRPAARFTGRQPDASELEALHHAAHDACFIANSVKTQVTVEPILSPEEV